MNRLVETATRAKREGDRSKRRQALLQHELEALLQPLAGTPALGVAILEGALALAMADGRFHDEEWQLFQRGLTLLDLQEQHHRVLSLNGAVDLEAVCAVFTALNNPAQCRAIAEFYQLLCDIDGERAEAEEGPLAQLLQALRYELPPGATHGI